MTSYLFIKKDLYFAPKIKRSNIFQEDILEIKLGKKTRFVLLTMYKSCFKNIFRLKFQIKQIEGVIKEVFFLEGNSDHLCLVHMPNVCGVCR